VQVAEYLYVWWANQWRIQDFAKKRVRIRQGYQNAEGVEGWDTPPPKN